MGFSIGLHLLVLVVTICLLCDLCPSHLGLGNRRRNGGLGDGWSGLLCVRLPGSTASLDSGLKLLGSRCITETTGSGKVVTVADFRSLGLSGFAPSTVVLVGRRCLGLLNLAAPLFGVSGRGSGPCVRRGSVRLLCAGAIDVGEATTSTAPGTTASNPRAANCLCWGVRIVRTSKQTNSRVPRPPPRPPRAAAPPARPPRPAPKLSALSQPPESAFLLPCDLDGAAALAGFFLVA